MTKQKEIKLGLEEQETHINRTGDSNARLWTIYTDETRMINELKRKGYEDALKKSGLGYTCEVLITIRTKARKKRKKMTPEQRSAAAERLRKFRANK